ncbi:MAG: ATP-binding cassette domain-containing protein [Pyrinomonadaceae bacterium]
MALRDVSIEVGNHEIFGIFGATGSGKSTLVEILLGNTAPSGGSIAHDGKDITKLTRGKRNFHFPALTRKSIWQNLFANDERSTLGEGEVQMRYLENALEKVTGVLILANSFCAMDRTLRERAFSRLRTVTRERDLSVVFAANNYEEILEVCDRVAILADSEIRQIGSPQDVYEDPASASIAAIVGRNNLFAARRLTSSKAKLPEYETVDGGHRLFTKKVERSALAPINQNVTLGIRPEQISLTFGASFPEDNLLKATVSRVRFLGATTLVSFDCSGLLLDTLVLRVVGLNIGDECMLGLPPDRIQIYKT